MEDVNISKFRAQVVRAGSTPASPGFVVSEGQNPVDPSGSGQNHLPVTIATASTGLSITESQVLGGAGTVGQYIRGDGSLADFPATTGGGSSVSYYLNGSVSQGTIGGVAYKELNKTPIFGAGTDISINADGYIASFITDAGDPNKLLIPAGNWNLETYFSASSSGGSPSFYVELYKYNGTTFTLIATSSSAPELIAFGTNLNPYFSTLAVPETVLALTDRLALRYYVTHSGRTITLHTENNHLCQVITTFTTGLTALNGLTSQVQYLTVGTSGTDFAISSATDTHTFNLPTASATNRGALSSADWTTFNNKTSNLGTVTSVGLSSATSGVTIGSTPITTSGTITLAIATASGSQNGLLSSTDWTTFNSKQNALTNPVTGTGTSGQVAYFTGTSAISSESNLVWDATNNRLGINTTPAYSLDVNGTGQFGNTSNNTNAIQFLDANSSKTHIGSAFGATFIQNNNFYNGSAYVFDDNTIGSANVTLSAGTINFQTGLANVNPSTKLTMFSDGKLLIQSGGTFTNNGARLQVTGTATINGASNTTTFNVQGSGANGILLDENSADATSSTRIFFKMNTQTYAMLADTNGLNFMTGASAGSTSGTPRVTLTSGGNVGIGGTSQNVAALTPKFQVLSNVSGERNNALVYFANDGNSSILSFAKSRSATIGTITYPLNSDFLGRIFFTGANEATSRFDVNGDISMVCGSTWSASNRETKLEITGTPNGATGRQTNLILAGNGDLTITGSNATKASGTAWINPSDLRLKTNIRPYNKGLAEVLKIQPKLWNFNQDSGFDQTKDHLSVIAQEIQDFMPEMISTYKGKLNGKETELLSIDSSDMTWLLVKAIQELKQEIDTLKN
jgi:hypothetical protein